MPRLTTYEAVVTVRTDLYDQRTGALVTSYTTTGVADGYSDHGPDPIVSSAIACALADTSNMTTAVQNSEAHRLKGAGPNTARPNRRQS